MVTSDLLSHMRPYQIPFSFTKVRKHPFYSRNESQEIQSSAGKTGNSYHGLPFITESGWRSILETSEPIQTADGVKKLSTYSNYLIWLVDKPTPASIGEVEVGQSKHSGAGGSIQSSNKSSSKDQLLLEGYALLEGCYLEACNETIVKLNGKVDDIIETKEIKRKHLKNNLERLIPEPTSLVISDQDQSPKLQFSGMGLSNQNNKIPSNNWENSQTKQTHSFKLYKTKGGPVSEVLFFESQTQMEVWRQKLADCLGIFQDFSSRYEVCGVIAKEGRQHTLLVKDVHSGDKYIAHSRSVVHSDSQAEVLNTKHKVINEAAILCKLADARVAPKLKELHFTGNSFVLIEEYFHATTFKDWFSEIWCVEHQDAQDASSVINLFVELVLLVLAVHSLEVGHGNISNETILVLCPPNSPPKQTGENRFQYQEQPANKEEEEEPKGRRNSLFKKKNAPNVPEESPLTSGKTIIQNVRSAIQTSAPKNKFIMVGFWDAVDLSSCDYQTIANSLLSDVNYDLAASSKEKFNREGLSRDLFELGKIFFDILFGININQALKQNACLENEFIRQLLLRPTDLILTKDPLYDINIRVVELIGKMLHPDPTFRPTIHECWSEIHLTSREGIKHRNYERQCSPRRNTVISRLSLDSYNSRISSIQKPVLEKPSVKPKMPGKAADSPTLVSLEISMKLSPRKLQEDTSGTVKKRTLIKPQRLGSNASIKFSLDISSKNARNGSKKTRSPLKLDLSKSLQRISLISSPKALRVESKELNSSIKPSNIFGVGSSNEFEKATLDLHQNDIDRLKKKPPILISHLLNFSTQTDSSKNIWEKKPLLGKQLLNPGHIKNNISFGGDTQQVPETPSFADHNRVLDAPFSQPSTPIRPKSAKVASRLKLHSASIIRLPRKHTKITDNLKIRLF